MHIKIYVDCLEVRIVFVPARVSVCWVFADHLRSTPFLASFTAAFDPPPRNHNACFPHKDYREHLGSGCPTGESNSISIILSELVLFTLSFGVPCRLGKLPTSLQHTHSLIPYLEMFNFWQRYALQFISFSLWLTCNLHKKNNKHKQCMLCLWFFLPSVIRALVCSIKETSTERRFL